MLARVSPAHQRIDLLPLYWILYVVASCSRTLLERKSISRLSSCTLIATETYARRYLGLASSLRQSWVTSSVLLQIPHAVEQSKFRPFARLTSCRLTVHALLTLSALSVSPEYVTPDSMTAAEANLIILDDNNCSSQVRGSYLSRPALLYKRSTVMYGPE